VDFDEAKEIRDLLDNNQIRYYETPPGNWVFGMAAIWLEDDSQLEKANNLIREYQIQREKNAKRKYEYADLVGKNDTLFQRLKKNKFLTLYFLLIFLVIFVGFIVKVYNRLV